MSAILSLIKILKKYLDYLIATNTGMNELNHSNKSTCSSKNNSTIYQVSACGPYQLKDEYTQLDDLLFKKTFYEHVDEHIDVQQYFPYDIIDWYQFIKELQQLTFPIGIYRIPENEVSNDRQDETLKALTSNIISCNIEDRLQLMLILANSNIIFDLRTNNGFKRTKFNIFWNETEAYFNEQNLLAVNERQHGTILYIPLAISICDLHKTIVKRLKDIYSDPLPSDIKIPLDE
ncbi:23985_t:CDS:2 [Gigaspora margarita]|uniref:23985_t:CDS:1 n=1 Tax=Gigaspora margarita TaxID=4874 RepID=A0ABN7VXW3_GIGMA|nr:23985_t:CDS:2 [Gigaspora margarita]